MIKNFKWGLLVSLILIACNDDTDEVVVVPITPGSAVLTNYVALGDSFAAGYSDGALFKKGQEGAYTNILSQQFLAAGGGQFKTPLMNDNIGGLLLGGNVVADPRMYFNGLSPVSLTNKPTTEITAKLKGVFNNLGIPGAKSFHLIAPGYGNVAGVASGLANPYFARFATTASTTVLADAVAQNPTFFTLWIGGNDVLSYATSGGVGKDQTGNLNPSTYGTNDITDPNVFANVYKTLVDALTAKGAKGVVANMPYVSTLPYFTTVPYNPAPLTTELATQLNEGYIKYNEGLQMMVTKGLLSADEAKKRIITFKAGNNAVVIVDNYLTDLSSYGVPSYRQTTKEDLLILTSRTFIGVAVEGDLMKVNGLSVPLADRWVLTKEEIAEVKKATDAYNVTIETIAKEKKLAFVDSKVVMNELSNGGVSFGNYSMSSTYVTGGAFSLDGVHPSARGYALIANKFIEAINTTYGATLKKVDLGLYPIQYPANL